jgi:ketosteroid isomerase-like protein
MILRKMKFALSLFAVLAAGAMLTNVAAFGPVALHAQETLEAQAKPAIQAYVNAIYKRDPALLDTILAPEFQVLRADGSAYDKAAYLASSLPVIEAPPQIEELVVTGSAELLVARYMLLAKQTRDGVAIQTTAPRLSIFRKDGDKYLLVAHANFAALER